MEVSKKELIVTFFINLFLMLIALACVIVLKGSTISLILASISILFIFVSSVISWGFAKHIDE